MGRRRRTGRPRVVSGGGTDRESSHGAVVTAGRDEPMEGVTEGEDVF